MAAKTWFATNTLVSNHQELSETSPGANATSSPNVGWVVGTTVPTVYAEFDGGTKQANGTFSATARPDGSINTAGDCLRTATTYSGSFASANWTLTFSVIGVTNSGAQDGRARFRLFRSANADGSSATEITGAAQVGSTVTNLSTTQQDSSITFNPGAFSLTNEYLFVQVGWEITGAGGMTTTDVVMRIGTTATRVVTSDFTNAYAIAAATGSFTETGNAANLLQGHKLAAAVGTFTETGSNAVLAKGRTMTADAGTFTLTGSDATLTEAGGSTPTLVAATGAFTETGTATGLLVGHRLTAVVGAFTETGNAAGLARGKLMAAAVGTFTETGSATGLRIGHRLTATTGAFTEAGPATGLRWGHKLTAAVGTFAETGNAGLFLRGKGMQAAPGAFALTGYAATFPRTYRLGCGWGAYVWLGAPADLTYGSGEPLPWYSGNPGATTRPPLAPGGTHGNYDPGGILNG